jgi:hypothetical protein
MLPKLTLMGQRTEKDMVKFRKVRYVDNKKIKNPRFSEEIYIANVHFEQDL